MDFQRARSLEQKDLRIQEITHATRTLLESNHYSAITLKQISDCCSFSRINLYNYFKTKEEIYLAIFLEDFEHFKDEITGIFHQYTILNPETFASLWSETAFKHTQMLLWFSLISTTFEPHARESVRMDFKKTLQYHLGELEQVVHHVVPQCSALHARSILNFCLNFGSSFYAMYDYTSGYVEADNGHEPFVLTPGFLLDYRENIITFIKGLHTTT